jgi:hypothetical protein
MHHIVSEARAVSQQASAPVSIVISMLERRRAAHPDIWYNLIRVTDTS